MAGIELDMNTTDPEQLNALFEKLNAGDTPIEQTTEPAPTPPATPEAPKNEPAATGSEPQSTQQDQPGSTPEPEPDGITTKDGKHVIPYTVLKSERDRATRAEQLAREAQERVAALEAQLKAGSQGANNGESARTDQQVPQASDLSAEDLEALKEDFPTVYKAVMASMAAARALEAKFEPVQASVQEDAAERARSATETVQEAIDAIPKMAHIQASDAQAFELAKTFDAALRAQPAWADKPLSERFAKVIDMVEAARGSIELPGQPKPAPQPSAEDLRKEAIARAAASAKANRTNVPTSLSEFAAGNPAAQDEREAAENMTHQQLAEKLATMTPDQMDAYFQTL